MSGVSRSNSRSDASESRMIETWTPPALSHGLLYIQQNEPARDGTRPRLVCYDLRAR